jgi:SpoVK/Ycf46/Vps4 family AAA+-type ATPase
MNSPDNKPGVPGMKGFEILQREHLEAELARIDLLLRREVDRWRKAGQDPADSFRGLYIADNEVDGLLARPFAAHWGTTTELSPLELEKYKSLLSQLEVQTSDLAKDLQAEGQTPRLIQLMETFNLDQFEIDALLICLAPTFDLRYERIYGYLQDDVTRKRPTVNLILNLLAPIGLDRLSLILRFSHPAPLIAYNLIRQIPDPGHGDGPLLGEAFEIDDAIVSWILGRYQPQGPIRRIATLFSADASEEDELLAGEILRAVPEPENNQPILALRGPDGTAKAAAARLSAARLGQPLLQVNLGGEAYKDSDVLETAVQLALRDGRLLGALVYLKEFDHGLRADSLIPELADLLTDYPGWLILGTRMGWLATGRLRERRIFTLDFPIPGYTQRLRLWEKILPMTVGPGDHTLTELAGQFYLTAGQILDTAATARNLAARRRRPIQKEDLFAAARTHSNPRLASLARQIQPRYNWNDIVLPGDQVAMLREIIATVRGRPEVLDAWGVGEKLASSRGVTVLFAGPPGTGKTMAAEIIAGELGLDLFKIDLSTVVSKYIGETEKNLERIFHEASASNAILFFDEADALFGKRSEVRDSHDRYANIEISYLLQRMEAYDGVTILATNLRANLDDAFTRRLQFSVDFPFPESGDRRRIWETLFPLSLPRAPGLKFDALADRFKLAGGNIRNILVSAAYLASADGGQVTMDHLLHGTRRELQKMGRLVNETDLTSASVQKNPEEIVKG